MWYFWGTENFMKIIESLKCHLCWFSIFIHFYFCDNINQFKNMISWIKFIYRRVIEFRLLIYADFPTNTPTSVKFAGNSYNMIYTSKNKKHDLKIIGFICRSVNRDSIHLNYFIIYILIAKLQILNILLSKIIESRANKIRKQCHW